MALETNALLEKGKGFLDSFTSASGMVIFGIVVIALLGLIFYYFFVYRRKFDILVKIRSERAGDPRVLFDYGAIFYDKVSKSKYLKLRDLKVELEIPPFKILEHTNLGDFAQLRRKSEDEFCWLTSEKVDKQYIIKKDGKVYPAETSIQREIEGDIEWTIRRKEMTKKLLDPDSILMKLLQMAPQILSGVFMIIIIWMFMTKLPEIFNTLKDLVAEMKSMKGGIALTG